MHLPQLNQEKKKSIKYEWDEVILDPPSWEQSKIVLSYLIQNYNVELPNDEIRKDWQQDLESKNLTSLLEEKPIIFPSKMRSLKKIEKVAKYIIMKIKEINILYGEGDKRRLRPGEEAAIIQQIDNMILDFQNHPDYIKLSLTSDIKFLNLLLEAIDKILFLSKFKELSNYPFCRKQVKNKFETNFRLNFIIE